MIIEIPDDNSIVKWKKNDKEDWKSAEISDLIKAYERPQGDLISREALRKNMEFICMGIMAGTEPYNAPLTEIDNAPTVNPERCGNNPKWCESCVSKGKCASTRTQGDASRDCSTCARYSEFQKEIPEECKGCKHNYFSEYKENKE